MKGRIFVFGGGATHTSKSTSVHSLALDGDNWTEEANLPIEVYYPEVASVENIIFLLDVYTNKLLHLDMKTKSWSYRKDLAGSNCVGARMVVVHQQILVAGGINKTAAQYDPKTDTWCTLTSSRMKHGAGALVGLENKLYLIGGISEDCIEEYNIDTGIWSVCSMRMPKKLHHLHALALDI